MKQIYLYGIAGVEKKFKVLGYYFIDERNLPPTIGLTEHIKYMTSKLVDKNPSIEHVYMIDNRHGLKRDLQEAIKKNSIESCYIFLDILIREGIKVI